MTQSLDCGSLLPLWDSQPAAHPVTPAPRDLWHFLFHSALGLDFGPAGKAPARDWQIADTKTRNVDSTKNRETLRVEKREACQADTLRLKLAPGGGACVVLEKPTAR